MITDFTVHKCGRFQAWSLRCHDCFGVLALRMDESRAGMHPFLTFVIEDGALPNCGKGQPRQADTLLALL